MNKIVSASRSLMAEYGLKANATSNAFRPFYFIVYVESASLSASQLMKEQAVILKSLIKGCQQFVVLGTSESVPNGCAVSAVSEGIQVHLLVKGMIDFDQEIAKMDKKISKVQDQLDQWATKKGAEGYMKIREDIRAANDTKVKFKKNTNTL
jgi:valyl-tRNA synthetase